jgi:hypothetical protein
MVFGPVARIMSRKTMIFFGSLRFLSGDYRMPEGPINEEAVLDKTAPRSN